MDLSGQTLRGHHGHTGGKLRNYFAKDFRADQLGVHGRDSRRYHTVLLDAKIRMLIKKGHRIAADARLKSKLMGKSVNGWEGDRPYCWDLS
ncbi:MAG: hypothetical protein NVS9B13_03390 [Candidatus Acidiferrum sp.]